MKKLALVPLAALAITAACADNPTAPSAFASSQSPLMQYQSDVWQAGQGSAFHGYNAPLLTWENGLACAAWNDDRHPSSSDHYSFEFLRWDGEGWAEEAKVDNDDGSRICLTETLQDGSYRLVGMAKDGKGQETTTHHTHAREFVVGGSGYSFVAIGGNCRTGTAPNVNTSTWNLTIQLFYGGELVTDGRDLYASGDLMNYSSANHEYHVNAKDSAGGSQVVWDFALEGEDAFDSFTCNAPVSGQGGGQGQGRNK